MVHLRNTRCFDGLAYYSTAFVRGCFGYHCMAQMQLTICCSLRQEVESGATDNPRLASSDANKRSRKVKKKSGRQ